MNRHRGHGSEQDETGATGGCAAFGPQLEAYYHHALNPQQAQPVAEHAANCALCRAALERFAATDQLIAAAPASAPGPELRQRLAIRIAAERAARSTRAAAPVSIERTTVVNDVNDVNDSPWTTTETQTRQTGRHWQWMRVWLGTAAAVLIVALLAGVLLTRPHGPAAGQVTSTPMPTMASQTTPTPDHTPYATSDQFTKPAGACNPANIQAHLPAHALLFDLAMVSPDEGWAVGATEDAGNGDPVGSLILHYINCAWTPVVADYSGATLMSVSMVSATDGWAVGGSSDGKQIALHYTGGAWQPVALPGENNAPGVYDSVHMRSAGEGWIVFTHNKNNQGIAIDSLLHLANGHWSAVDSPITSIRDVLPVAQNEAWMAGTIVGNQQTPTLYHYQAGSWTSASLPTGVNIDRLRMVSPNDIWASGHINAPSNWDSDQTAAVLRYDGSHWQQVDTGASGHPQFVQAFDGNTSLAFTISDGGVLDFISSVRYQRGGSWLAVRWPFSDMGMGLVAFGMNTIQRVSADEYWTIGLTGTSQSVLLYFANGAWHRYTQ